MRRHNKKDAFRIIAPILALCCILALLLYGKIAASYDMPFESPDAAPVFAFEPSVPFAAPPASPSPAQEPAATQTPEPDFSTPEIKIQMAGDVLLHTGPVSAARISGGYDFAPYFDLIAPCLDGDLTICNMEGPVDAYGENQRLSSYPQFNAPYEILSALRASGFNFLLAANNHAFDMGWGGLMATRRNMEKAGIDFTGIFETQDQYDSPKILDINGLKVGILNYTDAVNGLEGLIPVDKRPFALRRFSSADLSDISVMTANIESLRAAGAHFVIVALHWGVEYTDKPSNAQMEIARALCDGGADVIMGGHPHCVQPVEWHESPDGRKSLIIYSLGNFFADQTSINIPKTQYGMLVSVRVHLDKVGALAWESADILPTMAYRYSDSNSPNGVNYRLLPLDIYAGAAERPDMFSGRGEWDKAQRAFAHVENIAGSDVPVMGR